jgi:amino acid carrier protein
MKVFIKRSDTPDAVSPFKAVTMALAGTLGVGNIVGVATAITAGGSGAVFWMLISAVASILIKYSEIVLAVKYRQSHNNKSEFFGGAMYYIRDGLGKNKLAVMFAVVCLMSSFTLGNIIQVNAAANAFDMVFNIPPIAVGVFFAITSFIVIWGGIKSISELTAKLIPLLSLTFIAFSMYIIIINYHMIPDIIISILSEAFKPSSAIGGIGGFIIMKSLRFGVARGIMSNEAGCGTAPIAHAGACTNSPAEQGCWGIFEVFVDTVILCSMTALVILIYKQNYSIEYDGIILALKAYESCLGSLADYVISISVLCFAFGTVICWSYYGIECIRFLSSNPLWVKLYIIVYCLIAVYGSGASNNIIWELSDFFTGIMTVVNTVCVCGMTSVIKQVTDAYFFASSVPKKILLSSDLSKGRAGS